MTEEIDVSPTSNEISDEVLLRIWEKAVDTQMHFNEMSAKSRQLGLTFVAAALGVGALLLANARDYYIHFPITSKFTFHAHVSGFVFLAAAAGVWSVRTLDVNVYHKMLRGAVVFGEDLEAKFITPRLGLKKGMTQAISHFSRYSDAKTEPNIVPYDYSGCKKVTAGDKVRGFYLWLTLSLLFAAACTFYATDISFVPPTPNLPNQKYPGMLLPHEEPMQMSAGITALSIAPLEGETYGTSAPYRRTTIWYSDTQASRSLGASAL
jgi:hypothetical protein